MRVLVRILLGTQLLIACSDPSSTDSSSMLSQIGAALKKGELRPYFNRSLTLSSVHGCHVARAYEASCNSWNISPITPGNIVKQAEAVKLCNTHTPPSMEQLAKDSHNAYRCETAPVPAKIGIFRDQYYCILRETTGTVANSRCEGQFRPKIVEKGKGKHKKTRELEGPKECMANGHTYCEWTD